MWIGRGNSQTFQSENHMNKKAKEKFEVLFVCTGNTCRSPVAEGILKKMLKDRGIRGVMVSSAGICSLENMLASPFAIHIAGQHDMDLSRHRSRQLTQKVLEESDLILVMSLEHLDFIKKIDEKAVGKTYLVKLFPKSHPVSNEEYDPGVLFIKDPIGGSPADYEKSFLEIENEVKRIFPDILTLAEKR